jgi:hypothetical protein
MPNYPVAGDDGYTPLTIDLPFNRAKSLTLYRMTGDPTANNLVADKVKIGKAELAAASVTGQLTVNSKTGADDRGLAPGSTLVYVFEGVGEAAPNTAGARR